MASHNFLLALLLLFHFQKAEPKSMAMASGDSCKRKCRDIKIPYPFGMNKEHCYLDETFEVKCNHSIGSTSLAWIEGGEIDFISLPTHSLRIKGVPHVLFHR
ncbi:hypothetical protein CDL12_13076 [Handroanthus impetiginosus]|uniref:Wall-associated receptor kinase galacturonan-binding domain-containing protein n=1 Tax=Handroanthus impetiginosus TaxID=429701 RepID=A0A2G9H9W2_9LAMI|nr:hypothetical protein CDL12_13076 [Handroanthus impetiginosus]